MKQKPVKHLSDCKICFEPRTVIVEGKSKILLTRNKNICKSCNVYNSCIAKSTDKALQALGF